MKKQDERKKRDVLVCIGTFSNCAFIGIPFIDMFTDGNSEAMMYLTVFSVAFNILLWTVGAYLITQDKKQISLKKAFLNPCIVGCFIGLLLFCVPQINIFHMDAVRELQQIVVYTGTMTAPLSMMIVGIRLADLAPKELFCDPRIYLAAFVRLVLSFGLTYLLVLPFKLTGVFVDTPYVLLAPPLPIRWVRYYLYLRSPSHCLSSAYEAILFRQCLERRQRPLYHFPVHAIRNARIPRYTETVRRHDQKLVPFCTLRKRFCIRLGRLHKEIKRALGPYARKSVFRQRIIEHVPIFFIDVYVARFSETFCDDPLKQCRSADVTQRPSCAANCKKEFFRADTIGVHRNITDPLARKRERFRKGIT